MAIANSGQDGGNTALLTFEGKLSIARAREIREMIEKALREGQRVVVEFGRCTSVDLSFLQLLCAAHREASRTDRFLILRDGLPGLLSEAAEAAGYCRDKGCAFDRNCSCLWVKRQSVNRHNTNMETPGSMAGAGREVERG